MMLNGSLRQLQSGDTISSTIAPGFFVTNMNGMQFGAGTSHALTVASARVVFGTTSPDVTLPVAGTYLVFGSAHFQAAAFSGDDFRLKLYNTTTSADIGTETAAYSRTSDDISLLLLQVVTVVATTVVAMYARNATSARGVIAVGPTYLGYVRLD